MMNDELASERRRRTTSLAGGVLALCCVMLGIACDRSGDAEASQDAIRAMVDSMMPALERLSALAATEPVRLATQSVDEVRRYIEAKLAEELPPEELEGVRITYTMLGLLPDTLRLRDLLLDLYTEQIAGYYDPDTGQLYVVDGISAAALRTVVAHELVHALQDQHTDLDSLIDGRRGNDRQTAAQAAIEGHATLVMFALLAEEATGRTVDPALLPDPGAQLGAGFGGGAQFPVYERAPAIIRETLIFPYAGGASFVHHVWAADGSNPHTAPVGDNVPNSTEQVMHPDTRFLNGIDSPTELRFAAGQGWVVAYENTIGAFEIRIFLDEHLGRGTVSALGWDGDRFQLVETPAGARALVWVSVWDDAASADRFRHAVDLIRQSGALGERASVSALDIEGRPAVQVIVTADTDPATVPVPALHCTDAAGTRQPCALTR